MRQTVLLLTFFFSFSFASFADTIDYVRFFYNGNPLDASYISTLSDKDTFQLIHYTDHGVIKGLHILKVFNNEGKMIGSYTARDKNIIKFSAMDLAYSRLLQPGAVLTFIYSIDPPLAWPPKPVTIAKVRVNDIITAQHPTRAVPLGIEWLFVFLIFFAPFMFYLFNLATGRRKKKKKKQVSL